MLAKKMNGNGRYMLKGSLKKNGYDSWRLVFSAFCDQTGEERTFFIEFFVINPALSPKECVLGFKNRLPSSEADLQYALAGTQAALNANQEQLVQPCYAMARAGCLGVNGKQMSCYYPTEQIYTGKSGFIISVGSGDKACTLNDKSSVGNIRVSYADLNEYPEMLCNAGSITWNIQFERNVAFVPDYSSKVSSWAVLGANCTCNGMVTLDGESYTIIPEKSYGYFDKSWGRDFVFPFFHLNASNLTSIISGKRLEKSCFVVNGVYEDRLSVLALIDDNDIEFHADKSKRYSGTYECTEMPEDEDGVKVHWSVSVHNKKYVLDIDVFCHTDAMFVRDYESPAGGRKVLKLLGGGTGTGEIRLYKQIRKNLELIEHATVSNATCEFGNIELP